MIGRMTPTLEGGGRTVNEPHRASMTGVREFGGFKGRRHSSVACVGQLGTGELYYYLEAPHTPLTHPV